MRSKRLDKIYNGYAIGISLSLSSFAAGMEMVSYTSLRSFNFFTTFYGFPTKIEVNLLKSSNILGAIGGSIIGGEVAEYFGFVKAMKLLCLIWISGIIFTFVSESVSMLIVGKAIKGMAIGVAFATVPTYLYEIIPLRRRARMLTLFTFFCALGNLFMFLLPIVLSHSLQGEHYLNFHWLVELIPVTFLTIAVLFIPESPKWLASSDKWTRAADILECIEWKNSGNLERRKTRNERVKLGDKHFVVKKYSTTVEIKSCNINALFGRKYIKEITVGILLQLLVDFMGVSKLAESLNYICSACQITSLEELRMVQTFVLVVRCLFMIIPILVLDSMKRRDVLVFGVSIVSIVMVSYMIMFLAFSVRRPARSAYLNVDWVLKVEFFKERASLVLALTVFMDVLHYALILPSSWLLILETFSTSSRTRGWVFISSLHWLFACSTSLVFPFLLSHLNGWLFFIFSLVCMAAVAMSFTIQETREIMLLDSSQIVFETARNKMGKTSTLIDTKTDSD